MSDIKNEPTNTNNNSNNVVTDPKPTPTQTINYEDLIAKARQDEKNKLYPEIEKLRGQLEEKTARINELLVSVATKDEDFKSRDKEISELKVQIEALKEEGAKGMEKDKTVKELQDKIAQLETDIQNKDTEITSIKTGYELKEYKAEKVKDVDESVLDLVVGNSKEEIDASVEKAKAVYEKIASKFNTNNTTPTTPQNQNPPLSSQVPPVNTVDVYGAFKNINDEDVRNMTTAQYKEYRKSIGLK